jgi:Rrf2 family nitric oxide-sensitive transcriptional repressor
VHSLVRLRPSCRRPVGCGQHVRGRCACGNTNVRRLWTVMRLTSFTDYGLRVLMRLAEEPDRLLTTEVIAGEHKISRNHLVKVVRGLAEGGFILTQRGAGGGMQLARPAAGIALGDVVRHLEARQALVECFRADGGDCHLNPGCRLKARLSCAKEAFLTELDRSSLADCVAAAPKKSASQRKVARSVPQRKPGAAKEVT